MVYVTKILFIYAVTENFDDLRRKYEDNIKQVTDISVY